MKVLIYGVGGIGGYLGSLLLNTTHSVTFISRGKNFYQLKENGLKLNSAQGKIFHKKIKVFEEFQKNEKYDLIILSSKLYDLDFIIDCIQGNLSKDCIILPFQNGIYAEEILDKRLDLKYKTGAVAQISAHINEDSEIVHNGKIATFFVGSMLSNSRIDRLKFFAQDCQNSGLDLRYTNKIKEKIWDKFIFLSAYSGVTTVTQLSIGQIFESNNSRNMFVSAMNETFELSKFFKIKFSYDPVEKWLEKIKKMPFNMTSSMYLDLKNKKKLELNWLSGSVCYYSRKYNIKSTVHDDIVNSIKLNYPSLV